MAIGLDRSHTALDAARRHVKRHQLDRSMEPRFIQADLGVSAELSGALALAKSASKTERVFVYGRYLLEAMMERDYINLVEGLCGKTQRGDAVAFEFKVRPETDTKPSYAVIHDVNLDSLITQLEANAFSVKLLTQTEVLVGAKETYLTRRLLAVRV